MAFDVRVASIVIDLKRALSMRLCKQISDEDFRVQRKQLVAQYKLLVGSSASRDSRQI
jgi:hypothetical protein